MFRLWFSNLFLFSNAKPRYRFLDLPGEVRNLIYDYIFEENVRGESGRVESPSLTATTNNLHHVPTLVESSTKSYRSKSTTNARTISQVFKASSGLYQSYRQIRRETHYHATQLWDNNIKVHTSRENLGRLLHMLTGLERDHREVIRGLRLTLIDGHDSWDAESWWLLKAVLPKAQIVVRIKV